MSTALEEFEADFSNSSCSEREDAAEPFQVSGIADGFGPHMFAHSQAGSIAQSDKAGPVCEASLKHFDIREDVSSRADALATITWESE